jgi:hypothetical protein
LSPSSFCLLFLLSLQFLSFWSPLSFCHPLFPSLYSVLFLSSILRLFFSSPWFSLSDLLKMFPFLSHCFFFFQNLSLSTKLRPMFPILFVSVSSPKIFPTSFPFFFLVSLLFNLYFFSFSHPQILYSFIPPQKVSLVVPFIFLSVSSI